MIATFEQHHKILKRKPEGRERERERESPLKEIDN
jgi:hypothetical protein